MGDCAFGVKGPSRTGEFCYGRIKEKSETGYWVDLIEFGTDARNLRADNLTAIKEWKWQWNSVELKDARGNKVVPSYHENMRGKWKQQARWTDFRANPKHAPGNEDVDGKVEGAYIQALDHGVFPDAVRDV